MALDEQRRDEYLTWGGQAKCSCGHDFGTHSNPHKKEMGHGDFVWLTDDCLAEDCICTGYRMPRVPALWR